MELTQAEVERLQQQLTFDWQAAIDARDMCDDAADNRAQDRMGEKLGYAIASGFEMTYQMQWMSLQLKQITDELKKFLPKGVGGQEVADIGIDTAIGAAATAIDARGVASEPGSRTCRQIRSSRRQFTLAHGHNEETGGKSCRGQRVHKPAP